MFNIFVLAVWNSACVSNPANRELKTKTQKSHKKATNNAKTTTTKQNKSGKFFRDTVQPLTVGNASRQPGAQNLQKPIKCKENRQKTYRNIQETYRTTGNEGTLAHENLQKTTGNLQKTSRNLQVTERNLQETYRTLGNEGTLVRTAVAALRGRTVLTTNNI